MLADFDQTLNDLPVQSVRYIDKRSRRYRP